MTPDKIIQKVLAKAGGLTAVAVLCGNGVKRQNVEYWVLKSRPIPQEHCPAIERGTGIPCEELRSDLEWVRVPDPEWPNGRPLLDFAATAGEQA